jgi:hypothetical protein
MMRGAHAVDSFGIAPFGGWRLTSVRLGERVIGIAGIDKGSAAGANRPSPFSTVFLITGPGSLTLQLAQCLIGANETPCHDKSFRDIAHDVVSLSR